MTGNSTLSVERKSVEGGSSCWWKRLLCNPYILKLVMQAFWVVKLMQAVKDFLKHS